MQEVLESVSWTVATEPVEETILDNNQLDIESVDSSKFSEHNTNSELSEQESVSDDKYKKINFTGQHCFVGKDKATQWLAHASSRPKRRTLRKNIVIRPPGIKRVAQNAKKERDCWELFTTPAMIEYIVECTNIYLNNLRKNCVHGPLDPESGVLQKPEKVTFYNCTKGGVDVVDELKSNYSVSRFCCRWPLRVFFTILDVAGINSHIIYKSNASKILARRIYLKNLALQLIKPQMITRSTIRTLPLDIRTRIRQILGIPETDTNASVSASGFCGICPRKTNRRTKKQCSKCNIPICNYHVTFICSTCSNSINNLH
ncbi:unnamed protein product [Acanthoscelides obtectus]|uniref:PiggyBac transposable element-derived protein domain-containing protein n=1 Tax=Acanthoscelides obtectus TaxID=200917 RepID=A0A9P0KXA8_ACAOB|nr:unnamed protein product [Acanthoscelides obtectus]CAK1641967.1 hypothetical protein AOBTE_LOCUS12765 [Acanthoscelides obtectus]